MLTGIVSGDRDGEARTYGAGVRWGRHLQEAEPDSTLVELLDQQGFAAAQNDNQVEMRRCPFYALAESSPHVICTLHHGIIGGALAEAGSEQRVERLDTFVQPGLCIAHLR
jgi:predicted ArsR family transcriptional regulator